MSSDLLGHIVRDGQTLGACYFPAVPDAGQLLQVGDTGYRITSVGWKASFERGRGLAELTIDVTPATE